MVLGQGALASSRLVGTYKFNKQYCGSGAKKAEASLYSDGLRGKLVITQNEIRLALQFELKQKREDTTQARNQLNQMISYWLNEPDSPEKAAALEQVRVARDIISKIESGVNCNVNLSQEYSANGSTIRAVTLDSSLICLPDINMNTVEKNHGEAILSNFEINGKILRIIKPESDDNGICPRGDTLVDEFTRLK